VNKSFHNVETRKSPFGDYRIGYALTGGRWTIRKTGRQHYTAWEARPRWPNGLGCFHARTLAEVSAKLSSL
jgi:hypothetical protein